MKDRFVFSHHYGNLIRYTLDKRAKPELQDAVMDLICQEKVGWDHDEWQAKLAELDACELTVGEVVAKDGDLT